MYMFNTLSMLSCEYFEFALFFILVSPKIAQKNCPHPKCLRQQKITLINIQFLTSFHQKPWTLSQLITP